MREFSEVLIQPKGLPQLGKKTKIAINIYLKYNRLLVFDKMIFEKQYFVHQAGIRLSGI